MKPKILPLPVPLDLTQTPTQPATFASSVKPCASHFFLLLAFVFAPEPFDVTLVAREVRAVVALLALPLTAATCLFYSHLLATTLTTHLHQRKSYLGSRSLGLLLRRPSVFIMMLILVVARTALDNAIGFFAIDFKLLGDGIEQRRAPTTNLLGRAA